MTGAGLENRGDPAWLFVRVQARWLMNCQRREFCSGPQEERRSSICRSDRLVRGISSERSDNADRSVCWMAALALRVAWREIWVGSERANSPALSGPGAHASCAGCWPEVRLPACRQAGVDSGRAELTLGDHVLEPGLEVLAAEQIGRAMMELGQIV